jgi:hypothetical protein
MNTGLGCQVTSGISGQWAVTYRIGVRSGRRQALVGLLTAAQAML